MNFYDQGKFQILYCGIHTDAHMSFLGGWFIHKIILAFTFPYDLVVSVCLGDSDIKVMIP